MKKITVLSVAFLAVGLATFADTATSTIENVVVRQRWPWKGLVDIDFTVRGKATGVKFVAKYDGVEPFTLAEKDLSGEFAEILEPGVHSVTWNPEKAGLSETALKNFSVSVEPEDKTYLILNLHDGSYRYAAAEPQGGWLADPANYQTNIVFRRVPKGTRNIGLTTDFDKKFNASNYAHKREVTLTSDYYLSVFMTTKAQRKYIDGSDLDVSDEGKNYEGRTYPQMRGGQEDGIDWPSTEHKVKPGCIIDKLRNIVKSTFSSDWIVDLPTSSQWEYAAKATTPFDELLSVGKIKVTDEDLYEKFTNNVDLVAIWHHNKAEWGKDDTTIGRKRPNGWGFYDMVGLGFEWCNDWYKNSYVDYSGVDPVGPTSGQDGKRIRRSMYTSAPANSGMIYYTTAYVAGYVPNDSNKCGYRFCINLKNMFKQR